MAKPSRSTARSSSAGGRTGQRPGESGQLPSISNRRRAFFLSSVLVMVLPGVVFFRLVDIQLVDNAALVARGEGQRVHTRELPAKRGDIYDRNGDLLATSLIRYTIWADPRRVTAPETAAQQLAPILEQPAADLQAKLTAEGAFSYLQRKVTLAVRNRVLELDLDGIHSYKEYARHYPIESTVRSSFVGFVGSEEQGLGGIEATYNDLLVGSPGKLHLEGDPSGNPIALGDRVEQPAQSGASLHLTIDNPFQFQVEQVLLEQVAETGSLSGTAIVMEPDTGQILAMATVVRREPAEAEAAVGAAVAAGEAELAADASADAASEATAQDNYAVSSQDRAVTWTYEPGSAMKPLTFAAILDTGTASAADIREVPYSLVLYDSLFEEHDWHPPQDMSLEEILRISSNIGTILWSQDLGKSALHEYLQRFGVGSHLLRQELPGESAGQLLELNQWSGTSIATIALGQGIAVTPLQMLNVYNVIANGGQQVPPQLVADVVSSTGQHIGPELPDSQQIISEATAQTLTDMLVTVVESGTGKNAAIPNYQVAGKTGTARKPLPTGGYEDADGNYRYITTFAGFLPADDPAVSILVALEEPQNSIYASQTAAPTFDLLAREAIRHFHIPPSVTLAEREAETLAERGAEQAAGARAGQGGQARAGQEGAR